MTDKIGIDKNIKSLSATDWNPETMMFYKLTETERVNILASLRELKRIQEAKVPEPFAWVLPGDDIVRNDGWIDARVDRWSEFTKPLYGPEVLDLLRRETAKNERIKELLRDPSDGMFKFASRELLPSYAGQTNHQYAYDIVSAEDMKVLWNAMSAALLAEVEKKTNDGK